MKVAFQSDEVVVSIRMTSDRVLRCHTHSLRSSVSVHSLVTTINDLRVQDGQECERSDSLLYQVDNGKVSIKIHCFWLKGVTEWIVVADGLGQVDAWTQWSGPEGVFADLLRTC